MDDHDTIAACATPPGRGGVAVIRISGAGAFDVAARLTGRSFSDADAGRFFRARFYAPAEADGTRTCVDDGLVLIFAAPHSYTGENVVECQCHGGTVAPRRVLEAALAAGARLARRGEFTQRAFLNGRLALDAAEAVIDLIDAKTDRAADEARARLDGAAAQRFTRLYEAALALSSRLEYTLDVHEDELPSTFIPDFQTDLDALRAQIQAACTAARTGRLLQTGALVVLAGAPNAGKSSLLNALAGTARAIVSDVAGTTRDTIEEWIDIHGWPVRLVDTAGLRETADPIEAEGVSRATARLKEADLVLALDCDIPHALRLHAKCDLGPGEGLPVSAVTGEGLDQLRHVLSERLAQLAAQRDETDGADIGTRQCACLTAADAALARAAAACPDSVLMANELRAASDILGRMTGRLYSEDLLDTLFSRFCVGK
jgi:tRNA modification GTPase